MSEVYNFEVSDGPGDFYGYTLEHLFGDVWDRPGLSLRDRRLLLIGMMVAEGLDGVLDIQDIDGKKWGERAFLKSLVDSSNDGLGVEAKIDLIRAQIETYRGGSSLIDDVTMVMCEYEKRAA